MNNSTAALVAITSVADVQDIVRASQSIVIHGAQTKPNLVAQTDHALALDTTGLTGIVEYQPDEYTFTAMAGTSLLEIATALAENGQYMPFDPPLMAQGATVGGTIGAGLSGARRYRYGGIRDFIVGVKFVDGKGQVVRGGGKVVKNAAGFDFPKLFVGSAGTLGVVVEATFKVFPEPPATSTIRIDCPDITAATAYLFRFSRAAFDIDAIDIVPGTTAVALWIRLGGLALGMADRCQRLIDFAGRGARVPDDESASFWRSGSEFEWVDTDEALVKVPLSPTQIQALDAELHAAGAARRYSVGGNVAWVAWPMPLDDLGSVLTAAHLQGLVLRANAPAKFIGAYQPSILANRVKQALDPDKRFPEL